MIEALDERPSVTAPDGRDLGGGGAAPSSRIQSSDISKIFASRFEQDTVPGTYYSSSWLLLCAIACIDAGTSTTHPTSPNHTGERK